MVYHDHAGTVSPGGVVVREGRPGQLVRDGVLSSWRFAWVLAGEGEYRRRGRSARVGAGWVALRAKGERDWFVWDRNGGVARWVEVEFDASVEVDAAWRASVILARRVGEQDVLWALLRWAWANRELAERNPDVFAGVIGAAWGCFVSGRVGTGEPARVVLPAVVVRALAWIKGELERNPARVMTNAEIARAAGCSVPWLQQLFKRHMGIYPVQAARQARVDRAIELLAETDEPVALVAAMCGFVSPSHLSRVLRQRVGTHASGLRKAMRAGVARPVRTGAAWTGALFG